MSEHEVIDDAGRTWTFDYRRRKTWFTEVDHKEVTMVSSANDGWVLVLANGKKVETHERLIGPAITFAQHYLPNAPVHFVPTMERVRGAATGDDLHIKAHQFDEWLRDHDDELLDAFRSAALAIEELER
jgi:hypothetical protein